MANADNHRLLGRGQAFDVVLDIFISPAASSPLSASAVKNAIFTRERQLQHGHDELRDTLAVEIQSVNGG